MNRGCAVKRFGYKAFDFNTVDGRDACVFNIFKRLYKKKG